MRDKNRREFLADVGRGMLVASLGSVVAADLEVAPAWAGEGGEPLTFGTMEPLVELMQETPVTKLLPKLVEKMKAGTDLRTLTAAGALANARTFGGHDYTGYHALMALAPAYQMAAELPEEQRPLPVLKVLYRNTNRIQEEGGRTHEALHPIKPAELPRERDGGELLREATRRRDQQGAEETFAALARGPIGEAFNHLQFAVEDEVDVHRVVLAWRSWVLRDITGQEHAQTLLRQSVRYCVDAEKSMYEHKRTPAIRTVLPRLLDQYRLVGRKPGERKAEDKWIERLAQTIYGDGRERAAEAAAAALAEGMAPDAVAEAISLAANRLVLCDPGRTRAEPGKPIGSVHGASVGVHASDSANAWRNIARVSNARNTFASLICGAFHTAGQNGGQNKEPYPPAEQVAKIETKEPDRLLRLAEAAIKEKNQAGAAALIHVYGQQKYPPRPVFDLLLRYAVSEDGALHAEKYYRTVTEEFAATRPAFRWRHLVALARVSASEYGQTAPGYAEARRLLKL
ncbi:MAG TPA: hypothetical protein VE999_15565 [Gemmataceae bacterium]|nr:hypothetical protein [Gemmataceae bacterium]